MRSIISISLKKELLILLLLLINCKTHADQLIINFTIPHIDANPYHQPYVAIWLESYDREAVTTIILWKKQNGGDQWLKDLRQWWRKIGRSKYSLIDGITSATRRPEQYQIIWNAVDPHGKALPKGKYILHIESVREKGGRDYQRFPVNIGLQAELIISDSTATELIVNKLSSTTN